jgi:hypothetical protein
LILSYTLTIFLKRFNNIISSLYEVVVLGVSLRCTQSNGANSYVASAMKMTTYIYEDVDGEEVITHAPERGVESER